MPKKPRRVIYFANYHWDENDRTGYLTEAQYQLLKPHDYNLRKGNGSLLPPDIQKLVFETVFDKCKEVLKGSDNECDIEVSIC